MMPIEMRFELILTPPDIVYFLKLMSTGEVPKPDIQNRI